MSNYFRKSKQPKKSSKSKDGSSKSTDVMSFDTERLETKASDQTKDLFSRMVAKSGQNLLKFFLQLQRLYYKNFLIFFQ